ncbi:hypothetical protein HWI79_3190 [Cryptosporidium felis]|nr:hypothetical protein HWI79_3190 [Cryptosporidium felis]
MELYTLCSRFEHLRTNHDVFFGYSEISLIKLKSSFWKRLCCCCCSDDDGVEDANSEFSIHAFSIESGLGLGIPGDRRPILEPTPDNGMGWVKLRGGGISGGSNRRGNANDNPIRQGPCSGISNECFESSEDCRGRGGREGHGGQAGHVGRGSRGSRRDHRDSKALGENGRLSTIPEGQEDVKVSGGSSSPRCPFNGVGQKCDSCEGPTEYYETLL